MEEKKGEKQVVMTAMAVREGNAIPREARKSKQNSMRVMSNQRLTRQQEREGGRQLVSEKTTRTKKEKGEVQREQGRRRKKAAKRRDLHETHAEKNKAT